MSVQGRSVMALVVVGILGASGCATVPKEAVQLSYVVGEDIQQIYGSYRSLVKLSFENIRQRGLTVIDKVFIPAYIQEFAVSGGLAEAAQASNQTERVEFWARLAVERIDKERRDFLLPIDAQEDSLLAVIDDAFRRMIRANAAVTAHLSSVREVEEMQDTMLEAMRVRDIRDKITDGIAKASDLAAEGVTKVETAAAALAGRS
jgi:hypothetical protein